MVRPGIHPLKRYYTLVLQNGATVQLPTIMIRSQPVFTDMDPTNNPTWTGKQITEFKQESAAAKFMRRFRRDGGGQKRRPGRRGDGGDDE